MRFTTTAALLLAASAIAAPALAQENVAAPASDATPIDVDAVQIPWGRPDTEISHSDRLYVSDPTGGRLCVIDPAANSLLACSSMKGVLAGLGSEGSGGVVSNLTATRKGDLVAVASADRAEVAITATATNQTIETLKLSTLPSGIAFTRDGRELWVALGNENAVDVFETRTFARIARIRMPSRPAAIIMSVNGDRAFVSEADQRGILVVDVKRRALAGAVSTKVGGVARLAITPNGKYLWAYNEEGDVDVFRTKGHFEHHASVHLEGGARSLTFAHVGLDSFAYVSTVAKHAVSVLDSDSLREIASVALPGTPGDVWPSGDGTAVFAAVPSAGLVERLDTSLNRVIGTIAVPQMPSTLIYIPGAAHKRRAAISVQP